MLFYLFVISDATLYTAHMHTQACSVSVVCTAAAIALYTPSHVHSRTVMQNLVAASAAIDSNTQWHTLTPACPHNSFCKVCNICAYRLCGPQEETSALPLIKAYFSATEMEGLVGRIMGKVTLHYC
jgi:hypothetical protein